MTSNASELPMMICQSAHRQRWVRDDDARDDVPRVGLSHNISPIITNASRTSGTSNDDRARCVRGPPS